MPSNLFFLLGILGPALLVLRKLASGRFCIALSMAGFLIFGYTSAGEGLVAPLEQRFVAADPDAAAPPVGIVVIGSGVSEVYAGTTGSPVEFRDGAETVFAATFLARQFPEARVIVSAGHGGNFPFEPLREADGMKRLMVLFGVSEDRIEVDGLSASTQDRVQNSIALIQQDKDKTWWLVTSAARLSRTIGVFRASEVEPVPYPVDYRWIPPFDPLYFYEFTEGLDMTDRAAKEWLGLA